MTSSSVLAGADPNSYALRKLDRLETQFLSCLHDMEGDQLSLFHTSWSQFQGELGHLQTQLGLETRKKIDKFVSIMVTVSTSLVEASSLQIVDDLKTNLLDAMLPGSHRQPAPSPSVRYIKDSLRWARANLHNPYPSKTIRSTIARKTDSSIKDVDAWFVDFRKRIGWSALRYSRFGNRKADIVDAATRFYTGSDPHRPLDSLVESELASIAATVEQMFQEKCAGSSLASCLDETVKDLTPNLRHSLSKDNHRKKSVALHSKSPRRRLQPYPTPERSPTLSSRTLCTPEPTPPLPSTSEKRRKRSRSSSSECPTDTEEQIRPAKRTRLVSQRCDKVNGPKTRHSPTPTLHTPAASCYPSPTASVVIDLTELPAKTSASASTEPVVDTGKRKRKPSDLGVARGSTSQPCISSNPLPLSVNGILDQVAFSPLPASAAVPETGCDSFGPFDPFFDAFMTGGTDVFGGTSSPLPLLNIVDDVAPTNVHVEFDQSWLSSSGDALAPSYDPYATGYNTNFDNFGGSVDLLNCQLWYGNSPLQPLTSAPCPENSTMALAVQHDASLPSPIGPYHVSSPLPPSPTSVPHCDHLTDKARELEELEARCATLRSELAAGRSVVSILP